ncbi:MAG: hypothetical protein ACPG7F_20860, partial [Aggregatilineales bacterium]
IGNRYPVMVMIDGMHLMELVEGDIIHITASEHSARFVRLRGRTYFYRSLLDRLEPRLNRELSHHEKTLHLPAILQKSDKKD